RGPMPVEEPVVEPPARYGRRRLLAVGRLHESKGFDLLIEAFAQLAGYFPNWDLVILGEGDCREPLQAQIEAAGLEQRISMPGRVGNVGQWYVESRSEEHTSELQSRENLVCRLLLEKKKK